MKRIKRRLRFVMERAAIALSIALSAVLFSASATAGPPSDIAQMTHLVETFSEFAGSTANAQSLVEGLHGGTAITLTDASNARRSFTPPTKPMTWRDVRIALALAQAELAAVGIAQPTAVDIEAVLSGGTAGSGYTMTRFTGVLTQHWSGLGWQQIALAHSLNLDLLAGNASRASSRSGMTQAAASRAAAPAPGSSPLGHAVAGAGVAATAAAAVQ
jgi:hypothetical protein